MHDEFLLECLQSEVRHLRTFLNHIVDVVEVEVALKQVSQRDGHFLGDGAELDISLLHVLDVALVPVFHHLDAVGFEGFVVVGVQFVDGVGGELLPD
jgi:hypothetical protein